MIPEIQVYCTVFDKNYLYQGVCLYRSLERVSQGFKLYCLALDDESVNALRTISFPHLKVVTLADLPVDQVATMKSKATYPQFCWSMQPVVARYVLDLGEPSVTYLESDSWFFSDPKPIFQELQGSSVSIAPHFYAKEFENFASGSGRYCTHFNFFRNDDRGRACLEFWRQQNFEYQKEKPHDYPGQKSLDYFQEKFQGVHEIKNRGAGVAPWNVQQYEVTKKDERVFIDRIPVIFYHYHQMARYQDGTFGLGEYPFSKATIQYLYKPYIREVLDTEKLVCAKVPSFNFKREAVPQPQLLPSLLSFDQANTKRAIHNLIRKIKGVYHMIGPEDLNNN